MSFGFMIYEGKNARFSKTLKLQKYLSLWTLWVLEACKIRPKQYVSTFLVKQGAEADRCTLTAS